MSATERASTVTRFTTLPVTADGLGTVEAGLHLLTPVLGDAVATCRRCPRPQPPPTVSTPASRKVHMRRSAAASIEGDDRFPEGRPIRRHAIRPITKIARPERCDRKTNPATPQPRILLVAQTFSARGKRGPGCDAPTSRPTPADLQTRHAVLVRRCGYNQSQPMPHLFGPPTTTPHTRRFGLPAGNRRPKFLSDPSCTTGVTELSMTVQPTTPLP